MVVSLGYLSAWDDFWEEVHLVLGALDVHAEDDYVLRLRHLL